MINSKSMAKVSAGLLMYRWKDDQLEVFLVHPGGPFFKNKNVWGIPKGEQDDEDLLETAKREFSEETGIVLKSSTVYYELGSTTYSNGKIVYAWALENGDFDSKKLVSNKTPFGWPEIDRGNYFPLEEAIKIISPAQKKFLDRLSTRLQSKT